MKTLFCAILVFCFTQSLCSGSEGRPDHEGTEVSVFYDVVTSEEIILCGYGKNGSNILHKFFEILGFLSESQTFMLQFLQKLEEADQTKVLIKKILSQRNQDGDLPVELAYKKHHKEVGLYLWKKMIELDLDKDAWSKQYQQICSGTRMWELSLLGKALDDRDYHEVDRLLAQIKDELSKSYGGTPYFIKSALRKLLEQTGQEKLIAYVPH
ncbi:MAG: hypothetical protein H6679_05660 [Epsilonproteobacteria bacterium]|nr:hypothetical protein [Campylobacterota bacterium]